MFPILGIASITTIAVVSTSCNSAVIHVASVEFDKDTSVVLKDHTKTLNYTVYPNNATVEDGKVTAVAVGETTITVTSVDNPKAYATCHVTATPSIVHVTSVIISKDKASLEVVKYDTLTATVLPEDAVDKMLVGFQIVNVLNSINNL